MQDIGSLTKKAVEDLLTFPIDDKTNKDHFEMQAQKAKVGMTYERDRRMAESIAAGQVIRVVHMISSTPEEKARYIKASMPKLIPASAKQ
jgi:hypothetical protein